MNILWIPNFFPFPANNGGKVVISNRIIQLSKRHKIHLLVESDPIENDALNLAKQYCDSVDIVPTINRSKLMLLSHLFLDSLNVARYKNTKMTSKVLDIIDRCNIDLINVDLPMVCINLLPIKDKISDIPIVINEHNIEYLSVKSKIQTEGISPLMKIYAFCESHQLHKWESRLYKLTNIKGYSFVSDVDLNTFSHEYPYLKDCAFLSPIGTNLPQGSEAKIFDDNVFTIVFPAAFDYSPNVHGALWFVRNVYDLIREAHSNIRLILVGKSPKPEIVNLACEDIVVTGTVDSIVPYMRRADMFIVPIFFGGGVKTKLIEMACWGKPIISTTAGCQGTLFKNGEEIIVEDDSNLFAKKCIDIAYNSAKYKSMTDKAYKTAVDNYLWDNIGEQYAEFIEHIGLERIKS